MRCIRLIIWGDGGGRVIFLERVSPGYYRMAAKSLGCHLLFGNRHFALSVN